MQIFVFRILFTDICFRFKSASYKSKRLWYYHGMIQVCKHFSNVYYFNKLAHMYIILIWFISHVFFNLNIYIRAGTSRLDCRLTLKVKKNMLSFTLVRCLKLKYLFTKLISVTRWNDNRLTLNFAIKLRN